MTDMTNRLAGAAVLALAAATAFASAAAGPRAANDPLHMVAVHEFDDEHADLYLESRFDRMNEAELAALPKGRAHIAYNAPSKCIPARLRTVLARVSAKFGPVTVNSTYRSNGKNRAVGGKKKSYHLSCQAVDFRLHGNSKGLMAYLARQGEVGGLHRYPSGFFHIDTGPRRSW